MKLADLIASFDERAEKTPTGCFWMTAKQLAFARSLAERERVDLMSHLRVGYCGNVKICDGYTGKSAQFVGSKSHRLATSG